MTRTAYLCIFLLSLFKNTAASQAPNDNEHTGRRDQQQEAYCLVQLRLDTGPGLYGLPMGLPVGIPVEILTYRSRLPVATGS